MTATADSKLTQARLKELLHYDPLTGIFTRLARRGQALAGDIAKENPLNGRVGITIDRRHYEAPHLAWLYVHGELPTFRIYRKNKDRSDNRIDNFYDPKLPMPKVEQGQLTSDRLRELLHYDPETGIFTNLTQRGRNIKAGEVSGYLDNTGYVRITIDSKRYQAHQLAWLYVHGKFPDNVIDHANGNRADNRIVNLRDVTRSQNSENQRAAKINNKSGLLGAYQRESGKWRSRIEAGGKTFILGQFDTKELAHQAYIDAKRALHSTCTI